MIVKETYISPNSSTPLLKLYSDKGFFIQNNGQIYQEVIVTNDEAADKYLETNVAIPAPIADEYFVYKALIGDYQNLTQEQILAAKPLLLKALTSLSDEEAYKVKFLFEEWSYDKNYIQGDRVIYAGELYNVIQTPNTDANPKINTECYIRTNKPIDFIEEWDDMNKKIYEKGEKTRIGQYIYVSLIDNNIWSPREFPAAWQIEGSQD